MAWTQKSEPWQDLPAQDTPVLAADMNRIEEGITEAHDKANTALAGALVAVPGEPGAYTFGSV